MKTIIYILVIAGLATNQLFAEEVVLAGKHIATREYNSGTLPRYQAGYVVHLGGSFNTIIVDDAEGKNVFGQTIELRDAFRVMARSPAVSFDGRVAVIVNAIDRHGRVSVSIAFYDMQGTLERIIRTETFIPRDIGFTADGSLWAIGLEMDGQREKIPHNILRQYDLEGKLVQSMVPRNSLSTDRMHPIRNASLATSRNYVGILSNTAKAWVLVSSEGFIVGSGFFDNSTPQRFLPLVVTDSGQMFSHRKTSDSNKNSFLQVVRVNREDSSLVPIDTGSLYNQNKQGTNGLLIGCDREQLVFRVHQQPLSTLPIESGLVWADITR